jgi:carboxymethylenebutenolidase
MCYDDNARPPLPPVAGGAAQGEEAVLTARDGTRFAAYLATPAEPRGAQAVIFPDVRGLHGFYKEFAERLAEQGIAALAIDYFGRTAGLTSRDEGFDYPPHVEQMRFEAFQSDVSAALDHLRSGEGGDSPTFIVGFCRGGSLALLTATRDLGLAGVVAFYAGLSREFSPVGTVLDQAANVRCPVLGLFGGADPGIPTDQVEELDRELDRAEVGHEIVIYDGAPHSFFDRRATEYAEASADAWTRTLDFITERSRRGR